MRHIYRATTCRNRGMFLLSRLSPRNVTDLLHIQNNGRLERPNQRPGYALFLLFKLASGATPDLLTAYILRSRWLIQNQQRLANSATAALRYYGDGYPGGRRVARYHLLAIPLC